MECGAELVAEHVGKLRSYLRAEIERFRGDAAATSDADLRIDLLNRAGRYAAELGRLDDFIARPLGLAD